MSYKVQFYMKGEAGQQERAFDTEEEMRGFYHAKHQDENCESVTMVRPVSIKMTWSGNLGMLLTLWRDAETAEAKAQALAELKKMAKAADEYNKMIEA